MDLIKKIKQRIYPAVSGYLIRATLMEGPLSKTGRHLRCFFIGNSLFMRYLMRKVYAEPARVAGTRKMWLPAVGNSIKGLADSQDICIAVLSKKYDQALRGLYAFRAQEYVGQAVDIFGSWEEIRARFHKKKRQISNNLAAKYGFSYRISTDMQDFDHFYHQMHLPHTKRQFGESSLIVPYEDMKKSFSKGFLLMVMRGRCPVAALLCTVRERVLVAYKLGVLDGVGENIKSGAQMALYYFQILYAKEQHFHKVDLLKIPSLIDNGIYRTKREWGAAVYPDDGAASWVYFFMPHHPERAAGFFENTPMIISTDSGLKGITGVSDDFELSPDTRKKLIRQFYSPGLEGLLVLTPNATAPVELSFRGLHA